MNIKLPTPAFPYGAHVYMVVNSDYRGQVTGYLLRPNTSISYLVSWSDGEEREHWDYELSTTKMLDGVEDRP